MSFVVVDNLQAVDIAHHNGDILAIDGRPTEDILEAFVEHAPIAESGERVAKCEFFELRDSLCLADGGGDVGGNQAQGIEIVVVEDVGLGARGGDYETPEGVADVDRPEGL